MLGHCVILEHVLRLKNLQIPIVLDMGPQMAAAAAAEHQQQQQSGDQQLVGGTLFYNPLNPRSGSYRYSRHSRLTDRS